MAENMSNLENYLRNSTGIHFLLRRKMIAAYPTDAAIPTLRELHTNAAVHELTDQARADLAVLIENEDAAIRPVFA